MSKSVCVVSFPQVYDKQCQYMCGFILAGVQHAHHDAVPAVRADHRGPANLPTDAAAPLLPLLSRPLRRLGLSGGQHGITGE